MNRSAHEPDLIIFDISTKDTAVVGGKGNSGIGLPAIRRNPIGNIRYHGGNGKIGVAAAYRIGEPDQKYGIVLDIEIAVGKKILFGAFQAAAAFYGEQVTEVLPVEGDVIPDLHGERQAIITILFADLVYEGLGKAELPARIELDILLPVRKNSFFVMATAG